MAGATRPIVQLVETESFDSLYHEFVIESDPIELVRLAMSELIAEAAPATPPDKYPISALRRLLILIPAFRTARRALPELAFDVFETSIRDCRFDTIESKLECRLCVVAKS